MICYFYSHELFIETFQIVGMPQYKNPFEKGRLIIQFLVKFPRFIAPEAAKVLESCLPPRPQVFLLDNY